MQLDDGVLPGSLLCNRQSRVKVRYDPSEITHGEQ